MPAVKRFFGSFVMNTRTNSPNMGKPMLGELLGICTSKLPQVGEADLQVREGKKIGYREFVARTAVRIPVTRTNSPNMGKPMLGELPDICTTKLPQVGEADLQVREGKKIGYREFVARTAVRIPGTRTNSPNMGKPMLGELPGICTSKIGCEGRTL